MIFRHFSEVPKEALNWRLGLATLVFGVMGASRGIDEGVISGTVVQKSFVNSFYPGRDELPTEVESNIVSMVQIACVGGSLFAFMVLDRIGRRPTAMAACLLWILGFIIVLTSSGNLGQLYAGRFVGGLGVGMTVTTAPTYLSEISPSKIRGCCICVFSANVYLGVVLGYFANYGTAKNIGDRDDNQWLIPNAINIMAAGALIIGIFFTKESPRYLVMKGEYDKALQTFSYLRRLPEDDPYVRDEFEAVKEQYALELDATRDKTFVGTFKELFTVKSNLYRICLAISCQILGQWSGAGSLTVYAPKIFTLVGSGGGDTKLLTTGIFGIVKLVSALAAAIFLVDLIGRKRSLVIGVTIQALAALYIGIYLNKAEGVDESNESSSMEQASRVAIACIYISGISWTIGWNSIQYLINAEIFPLNTRSLAVSIVMAFHFANQYGNSRAFNPMVEAMQSWGVFIFFACECFFSVILIVFFLPETAGRPLEEMSEIFEQKWYKIGRTSKVVHDDNTRVQDVEFDNDIKK